MTMRKSIKLMLILFLFMVTIRLSWSTKGLRLECQENDRKVLLSFKQGLTDHSNRLASWIGQDCCKWQGVRCNNRTGDVVKLDLRNPFPFNIIQYHEKDYAYMPYNKACLKAVEVNPSLLELKHLNYLDLSWNNFSGIKIPKFFGAFQELKYLNLSSAWFGGTVPHHLGNLSTLHSLDLSLPVTNFGDIPELIVDTLPWISNLISLQRLDMSRINLINKSSGLSSVTSSLPSLLELRLSSCGLDKVPLFHSHDNVTSLVILDLSSNDFEGSIPNVLRNMTSLKILDLSYNQFSSKGPILDELNNLNNLEILDLSSNNFEIKAIQHLGNSSSPSITDNLETFYLSNNQLKGYLPNWLHHLKNLKNLDLSSNSFHGPIPATFGEFPSLQELDLSSNNLNGSVPTSLGNLSALEVLRLSTNELIGIIPTSLGRLSILRVLDLSNNQLSGQIPMSLGSLSNLSQLDLSNNELSGQIPMSLGRLSNLIQLNLRANHLNGTAPENLGQLSKLTDLDLSINSLSGVVSEVHFAKLSKLESLALSMNSFSLKIRSGWAPPFQLKYIDMGSCKVGPQFPEWIRTQTQCTTLDVSNASISGSLPNWFGNHFFQLSYLDLSGNQIYGKVPNFVKSNSPSIRLYLGSNRFEGPFPHFPSNVGILDLSDNKITGPIPENIGEILPTLVYFFFSSNHINGSIPKSLCKIQYLEYLDLSKNQLSGSLPQCWSAFQTLRVIDLASNHLSGTIPTSIGQLSALSTLKLSNNNFHGKLSSALRNCASLSIIDLGENALSGKIPTWIGGELSSLRILRLRSNKFNGRLPSKLCRLTDLHIMDLAHNNLHGTIPRCFRKLRAMVFGEAVEVNDLSPYTDKLMQVIKGRELEYINILSLLINLDLSGNNLTGQIPKEVTRLSGLIGLNLSENHLAGSIPQKIGEMKSLESLDFSMNRLSGTIPQSISSLSSLSHLNLSYNNLSGAIPSGSQLRTFEDISIYEGNLDLCGPPLEKKCAGDEELPQPPTYVDNKGRDEGDEFKINWFYIGMASGFVVGFWGVCGVLLFKKNWRYAYFRFVDDMKDKLLFGIADGISRLKKKLKGNQDEE